MLELTIATLSFKQRWFEQHLTTADGWHKVRRHGLFGIVDTWLFSLYALDSRAENPP